MTPEAQTLVKTWRSIPKDARTEALNGQWYRESRRVARALARKHGVTLSVAAGVIAALSPRQQWVSNVAGADDLLGGGEGCGFGANRRKAEAIRNGERPLDVLSGPKVRAFYRAIMGDRDSAVVDVWMYRAMGHEAGGLPYPEAAAALEEAARKVRVAVADFQAIVWTYTRGRAT